MPQSQHRRNGKTRPRMPRVARDERFHDPRCEACSDPTWTPERAYERTLELIDRNGWATEGVLGDRGHPPYAYTVGLALRGLPELVLSGLDHDVIHATFHAIAPAVLLGLSLVERREIEKPCGCLLRLIHIPQAGHALGVANMVNGSPVRAVQLVWSAGGGRFPREPGYPEIGFRQQLFGRPWW